MFGGVHCFACRCSPARHRLPVIACPWAAAARLPVIACRGLPLPACRHRLPWAAAARLPVISCHGLPLLACPSSPATGCRCPPAVIACRGLPLPACPWAAHAQAPRGLPSGLVLPGSMDADGDGQRHKKSPARHRWHRGENHSARMPLARAIPAHAAAREYLAMPIRRGGVSNVAMVISIIVLFESFRVLSGKLYGDEFPPRYRQFKHPLPHAGIGIVSAAAANIQNVIRGKRHRMREE